jgi:hypothetical protein
MTAMSKRAKRANFDNPGDPGDEPTVYKDGRGLYRFNIRAGADRRERRGNVLFDVYVTVTGGKTFKNGDTVGPTTDVEWAIDAYLGWWFYLADIERIVFRARRTGAIAATMTRCPEPRDCRITRPGREVEIRRAKAYSGYPGSDPNWRREFGSAEEFDAWVRDKMRQHDERN